MTGSNEHRHWQHIAKSHEAHRSSSSERCLAETGSAIMMIAHPNTNCAACQIGRLRSAAGVHEVALMHVRSVAQSPTQGPIQHASERWAAVGNAAPHKDIRQAGHTLVARSRHLQVQADYL